MPSIPSRSKYPSPAVERRCVRLRVVPELVAEPVAGVRERIVRAVVEEPRVAAAPVDPLSAAAPTSPRRADDPADEHLSRTRPPRGAAGARRTTSRETVSPSRPLSRKRNADSGEITYGGLQVTSPKRLPSTGSKKLPQRNSMFSAPFSLALNAANLSARSLTSVATTRSLWRAARIAWTPEPVPTSSAVSTCRRTVRCESVSDGPVHPRDVIRPRLLAGARAGGRRRRGRRRAGRCGRRSHVPPVPRRGCRAPRVARAGAGRMHVVPRRADTGASRTSSRTSVPSGSTPSSLRSWSGISTDRDRSAPAEPSAVRTPSPVNPAARKHVAKLLDRP